MGRAEGGWEGAVGRGGGHDKRIVDVPSNVVRHWGRRRAAEGGLSSCRWTLGTGPTWGLEEGAVSRTCRLARREQEDRRAGVYFPLRSGGLKLAGGRAGQVSVRCACAGRTSFVADGSRNRTAPHLRSVEAWSKAGGRAFGASARTHSPFDGAAARSAAQIQASAKRTKGRGYSWKQSLAFTALYLTSRRFVRDSNPLHCS